MSNELSTLNNLFAGGEIANRSVEQLTELSRLSQGTDFLRRIQLYSRGKAIDKKLIEGGHFGIPMSSDKIVDLGESIDVLVLEVRAKAIDMSDNENLIVSYDSTSKEFQRIEAASAEKDSGCSFGPSYLVWERTTGQFYEFFCGSKSARIESSNINDYLPVTPAMIAAGVTDETEPRGPKPCTLNGHLIETKRYSWHVPKPEDCLTPFDKLPTVEQLNEEVKKFLTPDEPEVETVEEDSKRKRRR